MTSTLLPAPPKPIFPEQPGCWSLLTKALDLARQNLLYGAVAYARAAIETWAVSLMPDRNRSVRFFVNINAIYRQRFIDRRTKKIITGHYSRLSDWLHLGMPVLEVVFLRLTKIVDLLCKLGRAAG